MDTEAPMENQPNPSSEGDKTKDTSQTKYLVKKIQPKQSKVDTMKSWVGPCEKESEDEVTFNPYKLKHEERGWFFSFTYYMRDYQERVLKGQEVMKQNPKDHSLRDPIEGDLLFYAFLEILF